MDLEKASGHAMNRLRRDIASPLPPATAREFHAHPPCPAGDAAPRTPYCQAAPEQTQGTATPERDEYRNCNKHQGRMRAEEARYRQRAIGDRDRPLQIAQYAGEGIALRGAPCDQSLLAAGDFGEVFHAGQLARSSWSLRSSARLAENSRDAALAALRAFTATSAPMAR